VFAAGDVRRGSVYRVASAAGDGAVAIRSVHEFLEANPGSEQRMTAPLATASHR
jgi:hypothetical protein